MKTTFAESTLAKLYLWAAEAKLTMGILFVVFVMVYLLLGFVTKTEGTAIDFFRALQMVLACFFIGILQQLILHDKSLTKPRCTLCIFSGVFITLAFCFVFSWFAQFPYWCFLAFIAIITICLVMLLVSRYLELHRETKLLNVGLAEFQNR